MQLNTFKRIQLFFKFVLQFYISMEWVMIVDIYMEN